MRQDGAFLPLLVTAGGGGGWGDGAKSRKYVFPEGFRGREEGGRGSIARLVLERHRHER